MAADAAAGPGNTCRPLAAGSVHLRSGGGLEDQAASCCGPLLDVDPVRVRPRRHHLRDSEPTTPSPRTRERAPAHARRRRLGLSIKSAASQGLPAQQSDSPARAQQAWGTDGAVKGRRRLADASDAHEPQHRRSRLGPRQQPPRRPCLEAATAGASRHTESGGPQTTTGGTAPRASELSGPGHAVRTGACPRIPSRSSETQQLTRLLIQPLSHMT